MQAVAVTGLSKRFDEVQALGGISFDIREGELFGFLGPNGAGKTTTINLLTGLARADSGSIVIDGIDCTKKIRGAQHLIGVVPDESNLYPELSGFDNLCFCASLYGIGKEERIKRARELLKQFDLSKAADRKFAGYSKGMKRKLTIAAGIIHRPKILFLDEPTTGIDVASARQLRQMVSDLHDSGTTIFLTTHYIEEAERLCDRIAFIVGGKIVRIDTVGNLIQPLHDKHIVQFACESNAIKIKDGLKSHFPDFAFEFPNNETIRIESDLPISIAPPVRYLEDAGIEVSEARKIRPSLEDVFVNVTGIEARAMRNEKEKKGGGK